jgi:hypothetical protein
MSEMHKTWIAPILTGSIATILGGFALLLFDTPATISIETPNAGVQGKTVSAFPTPPAGEWEPMQNEASYARNYSRAIKQAHELFQQVVTIYETPMASDRREGKEVAPGEYVEIFKVGSPTDVVIQIRIDKKDYWLLSRQRISLKNWPFLALVNPEEGNSEFLQFQHSLQNIVDSTRHFLRTAL